MSERFLDLASGLTCPACSLGDKLYYEVIGSPVMKFQSGSAEVTITFDDVRDYRCDNCDFGFMVPQGELDCR